MAIDESGEKLYFTNNKDAYSVVILNAEGGGEELNQITCVNDIINIRGITVDPNGNVYVTGDHMVQKYDRDGSLNKCVGNIKPNSSHFYDPNGIRWHSNKIFVCDSRNRRVKILTTNLKTIQLVGGGYFTNVLEHPEDLDFDKWSNMYVIDSTKKSIVVFNSSYYHIKDIIPGDLKFPVSMRIFDGHFYVSDNSDCSIMVFDMEGKFVNRIRVCSNRTALEYPEENDSFSFTPRVSPDTREITDCPIGIEVDCDGYIYVCNIDSNKIQVY